MILLACPLFLMMGIVLGLTGAGGAILSIPILVHVVHLPFITSTSYSLFIVGIASLFAVGRLWRDVRVVSGFLFALPSMASVYLTRSWILPGLPDPIFSIQKNSFLLHGLILLMLASAYFMIRPNPFPKPEPDVQGGDLLVDARLILTSIVIGAIIALTGVGGGFLTIPALTILLRFEMHHAVATSLLIVALNTFFGVLADFSQEIPIDYSQLAYFIAFSLVGMWLGTYIGQRFSSQGLKRLFGWFLVCVALLMLVGEWGLFL